MRLPSFRSFAPCFLLMCLVAPSLAQTPAPDLDLVSKRVENYFSEKKPTWKHETTPPPTPPGYKPSPNVIVHFWSSDKCLTAELKLDGIDYGVKPVPCRVHLAIYLSASAAEAQANLEDSVYRWRGERFEPLEVGDKGYLHNGSSVVFVKGKFTFWLDGRAELNVGHFSIDGEFIERLAKEIAGSVGTL